MEQDNCIPRFFINKVIDKAASAEAGVNVWKDAEYVEILIPNSRDNWIGPVSEQHMKRWPNHYRAFQEGQEAPIEGTPLEVWPAITPAIVENLKRANVRTVEALAGMQETGLQRFGPDIMKTIQKARAYVDSKDNTGEASKLVDENARLKREVESLQEEIAALKAKTKVKKKAA